MRAIYKSRLPFMEKSYIDMPEGAEIIRIDGLEGAIWVWAVVDTEAPIERRDFLLFKTGATMPSDILDTHR